MRPKIRQLRAQPVPRRAAQGGQTLLYYAMFVTLLVLAMGLAFMQASATESLANNRALRRLQANAAAEYGIARACGMANSGTNLHGLWFIMTYNGTALNAAPGWVASQAGSVYGGYQICNLFTNQAVPNQASATYTVVIQELNNLGILCSNYRIHSYGTVGDFTRHVSLDCQALNFGAFAWLTNQEKMYNGSSVYWATGEQISGWNNSALIWSNGQFNITGNPAFNGMLYTGAASLNEANGSNPTFLAGYPVYNAPNLPLSSVMNGSDITAIKNGATTANGGVTVANSGNDPTLTTSTINDSSNAPSGSTGNTTNTYGYNLVFNGANYTIYKLKSNGYRTLSPAPTIGTIPAAGMAFYFKDQVLVSGTLTGQVTIGTQSPYNIQIVGDLTYSYPAITNYSTTLFSTTYNPLADANFTSKLALVSGGDIIIQPTTWNGSTGAVITPAWSDITGSAMHITATMAAIGNGTSYTTTTTPGVFWNYFWQGGSPQATLYIYGGICQEDRGPVGQVGSTGFKKNYVFDPRLGSAPPPFLNNMNIGALYTNWQLY